MKIRLCALLLVCFGFAACETGSSYSGRGYYRRYPSYSTQPQYQRAAYTGESTDDSPEPQHDYEQSAPRQPTLEERQEQARTWLVVFMATRFAAHHSEPVDFSEAVIKELAKWGSDWGINDSLNTLFPDASGSERAALRGVITALTELKLTPDEIAGSVTKEVFMEKLSQRDSNLATQADIVDRAWSLIREGIKAANR